MNAMMVATVVAAPLLHARLRPATSGLGIPRFGAGGCSSMDTVAESLAALGARRVLVEAANAGHITSLSCTMPECLCPDGRSFFEPRRGRDYGPWSATPDRYPTPGRAGGGYVAGNVRLAHRSCNQMDGARVAGAITVGAGRCRAMGQRAVSIRRERGDYDGDAWLEMGARGRSASLATMTPEARSETGRLGALAQPREARVRGAVATVAIRKARGDFLTPEWRAAMRATGAVGGAVGNCQRWNIDRGKPCTCGRHT